MADERDDSNGPKNRHSEGWTKPIARATSSRADELNSVVLLAAGVLSLAMFGSVAVQRFAADFTRLPRKPGRLPINAGSASAAARIRNLWA
jgi:hypothetical protein